MDFFILVLFYIQVFSLDTPDAFQFYYNPLRAADRNTGMEKMAEQIATLCSTLGEYPSIRYRLVGLFIFKGVFFLAIEIFTKKSFYNYCDIIYIVD